MKSKLLCLPVVAWIHDRKLPIFLHITSHDKNRCDVREHNDSQRNRSVSMVAVVIQVSCLENIQDQIQLVHSVHTKRTNQDFH